MIGSRPPSEIDSRDARVARGRLRQAIEDLLAWSSTMTRSTTRMSTPMMCSTYTMVMAMRLRMRTSRVGGALHRPRIEAVETLVGEQRLRPRRERSRQFELLERGGAEPVGGGGTLGQ